MHAHRLKKPHYFHLSVLRPASGARLDRQALEIVSLAWSVWKRLNRLSEECIPIFSPHHNASEAISLAPQVGPHCHPHPRSQSRRLAYQSSNALRALSRVHWLAPRRARPPSYDIPCLLRHGPISDHHECGKNSGSYMPHNKPRDFCVPRGRGANKSAKDAQLVTNAPVI